MQKYFWIEFLDNGQIILDGILDGFLDCFLDCFLDVVLDGTLDWFGWELGLVGVWMLF